MIVAVAYMIVIMLIGCICLAVYAVDEGDVVPSVVAFSGIIVGIASLVVLISSYCINCNALLEDCSCEPVCCECGQTLPESEKECNRQEPMVEPNKCCGSCGQEIVVNVEVNCEHTTSVEIETTPETAKPESTKPPVPDCPNCNKGVASAFCPYCGYDMHATVDCPSCNKEFKPSEVPLYCPDCGTKTAIEDGGEG